MKKKPVIVLTHPLFPSVVQRELGGKAIVRLARTRPQILRALRDADGLVSLLSVRIDEELLSAAPKLRAIGNVAVGFDNIDLAACASHGVRVANTPDVLTRSTAELAVALLFAAARRIPEGEALCRKGAFRGWAPEMLLGQELKGRTAVLVGPGRIGKETGRMLRALGLRVLFVGSKDSSTEIRAKLGQAQILSLHLPLNTTTRHWLDSGRLKLLPRDAIVINTTRGPTIDEKALIRALRTRRIFAAGLDVFEREPEIPKALRELENVVLLPHLGSATVTAREGMARLAIRGVLGILGGKRVRNEVKYLTPRARKNG